MKRITLADALLIAKSLDGIMWSDMTDRQKFLAKKAGAMIGKRKRDLRLY